MPEDKDREESALLGELPQDMFEMKGDRYPPKEEFFNPNIPADVKASAPLADLPQVSEDRTLSASIRSTFDTRPINGTDFHYSQTNAVQPTWDSDVISLFTYTVPESYIAVLRNFEYTQYPYNLKAGAAPAPAVSILINGITQVGHSNFKMEPDTTPQPTHVIAPENAELTVRIIYPQFYSVNIEFTVWVHMYGNLILTKNLPPAFEVGNQIPAKSIPIPKAIRKNPSPQYGVSVGPYPTKFKPK